MNKLSPIPRLLFFIASLILVLVLFFPIWQIELDAPQYPEGLVLKIYTNKLGGDLDVVNGLNHYIGMRKLKVEDFVEFKILPYIFIFFAIFGLIGAVINRKKLLYLWLFLFIAFAILAMVDFWRWEYDYGHNLDTSAPIQVPGMAYQPPLIGFKQLLNFGAFSIPDIGGWIFIASALLGSLAAFIQWKKRTIPVSAVIGLLMSSSLVACQNGPKPINYGKQACDFCKMTITDARFGNELITDKGKVYFFDDFYCLKAYIKANKNKQSAFKYFYAADFAHANKLLNCNDAFLLEGGNIKSPMGSDIAAFSSITELSKYNNDNTGQAISWEEYLKK